MKRCSAPLRTRNLEIKTIGRHHFTPTRVLTIKTSQKKNKQKSEISKSKQIIGVGKKVENWHPVLCWRERKMGQKLSNRDRGSVREGNTELPQDPAVPLPRIDPKNWQWGLEEPSVRPRSKQHYSQ